MQIHENHKNKKNLDQNIKQKKKFLKKASNLHYVDHIHDI